MPYILSPRYQLQPLTYLQLKKSVVATLNQEDTFVLVKDGKRSYLINRDIHRFLHFLQTPQSKKAIDRHFSSIDWYPFFKQLLKRGVLLNTKKAHFKNHTPQSTPFLRLAVGDKIEGFQIEKLLAFRNYTQTCIAKKKQQPVVIKALSLPPTLSNKKQKKLIKHFRQEFELMQQLPPHPNVSKLLVFRPKEKYAVLQLIKGKTLGKVVRKKTLKKKEKETIIVQMIEALSFLHQCHLIHGDLHHRNVMVSKKQRVTLLDFGLSYMEMKENLLAPKMGGIDLYLPPERIAKSSLRSIIKPATFQSDVYQLGILLYYLLFEKFPFTGFTWEELYGAIQHGEVAYPNKARKGAFKKYIPIIKKCLCKEVSGRFENAMVIREVL